MILVSHPFDSVSSFIIKRRILFITLNLSGFLILGIFISKLQTWGEGPARIFLTQNKVVISC